MGNMPSARRDEQGMSAGLISSAAHAMSKKRFGYGALLAVGVTGALVGAGFVSAIERLDTGSAPQRPEVVLRGGDFEVPEDFPLDSGADVYRIGDNAVTGNVSVVVESVSAPESVSWDEFGIGPQRRAREGKKLVAIEAKVKNSGSKPLVLSCGSDLSVALGDVEGAAYKPLSNLYRLEGNPECLVGLRPGLETEMTWLFEVEQSFQPSRIGLLDTRAGYRNAVVGISGEI